VIKLHNVYLELYDQSWILFEFMSFWKNSRNRLAGYA